MTEDDFKTTTEIVEAIAALNRLIKEAQGSRVDVTLELTDTPYHEIGTTRATRVQEVRASFEYLPGGLIDKPEKVSFE